MPDDSCAQLHLVQRLAFDQESALTGRGCPQKKLLKWSSRTLSKNLNLPYRTPHFIRPILTDRHASLDRRRTSRCFIVQTPTPPSGELFLPERVAVRPRPL